MMNDPRRQRLEAMRGVREVRRIPAAAELRESAGGMLTFAGLASRTATAYDMGSYQEQIARGAFGETLKRNPDVQLLINHEGLPIARTTIPAGQSGSLVLREDQDGLSFEAMCDPTDPDVSRVAAKVRSGLMDQCSFAFRVVRQDWKWQEDTGMEHDQRIISEVSLDRGDVSIVNYGANPATSITARALMLDMSDEQLRDEFDDDDVNRILRARATGSPPVELVLAPVHDLELFRARAFALVLRQSR